MAVWVIDRPGEDLGMKGGIVASTRKLSSDEVNALIEGLSEDNSEAAVSSSEGKDVGLSSLARMICRFSAIIMRCA